MQADRSARHEEGVSTVLGGILFFALVVMFLVVVRTTFAPVWQGEDEAAHLNTVQGQFASIKSETDRQAANTTSQPLSMPVTLLERTTSRFFTPPNIPATLSFSPATSDVILETNEFLAFERGGRNLLGIDETWTDVAGAQTISDADDIRHLRLRILDPGNEDDGDSVTLTVTDKNGDFAGDFTVYMKEHPSGYSIVNRVRGAGGSVIYDQGESLFQQDEPAFWWIDTLSAELHFIDVLAAAVKPLSIDLVENGMSGQFTTTYVDGSGGVQGGSGSLLPDYASALDGGTLRFESTTSQFPQQTYILEAGAVIIEQADGSVMRTRPVFDVELAAGQTTLRMTLPSLVGTSDAVSSQGTASVHLDARSAESLVGTAPHWNITLETGHPQLWASMWQERLDEAGLDASAGEFQITTTATQASLSILGTDTDPASTVHDISIRLDTARIDVRLQT